MWNTQRNGSRYTWRQCAAHCHALLTGSFNCTGYAYYISSSKAVLASLVDSVVDLVSQIIIFVAEYKSKVRVSKAARHVSFACRMRIKLEVGGVGW